MTHTLNHERSSIFHGKNNGCTLEVFLLVLSSFLFLQKHKKKRFGNLQDDLASIVIKKENHDQTIPITGVGDD